RYRKSVITVVGARSGVGTTACMVKGMFMAKTASAVSEARGPAVRWYAQDAAAIAKDLSVDTVAGLKAAEAAERLQRNGPNELPAEEPPSALRRFLAQYTSYMQLILVGATVVSFAIGELGTAILLVAITLLN